MTINYAAPVWCISHDEWLYYIIWGTNYYDIHVRCVYFIFLIFVIWIILSAVSLVFCVYYRYLGTRAVKLFRVKVHNSEAMVAVSSRTWLSYTYQSRFHLTPLSYDVLEYTSSFSSEQCPEGIVAIASNTLRYEHHWDPSIIDTIGTSKLILLIEVSFVPW